MRSTFSSGVRLAVLGLFFLLGGSIAAVAQSGPLMVSLTTDRGCGPSAVYNIGDSNQFLFSVSKIASVTLTLTLPDGTVRPVRVNMAVVNGVTYSIPGVIGNPPGQRLLTLDAVSGTETAHAQCTYTAAGTVGNPLTVTLTTDRGCGPGAVYNIGDADTFRYSVSKNAQVTLTLHRPDGTVSTLLANQPVQGGAPQSLSGVIGNPPGQRLLTLDAVAGTETAHAECTYSAQGTVTNPLTVTLTTNRGCGPTALFNIGEPDTFTYSASKNALVTLQLLRPDGTTSVLVANQAVTGGMTQTRQGMIGNPPGQRRLILDAVAGTETAHAECTYTAAGSTGGGPLILSLSINKGCGSQYRAGEGITITYSASANTSLTLVNQRPDGTQQTLFSNQPVLAGQSYPLTGVVGNITGTRTLILSAPSGTTATPATCQFTGIP